MATSASPSIADLHQRYREGHTLVAEIEGRLRQIRADDVVYRSMLFVGADDALESAARAERGVQAGTVPGLLYGVPIAVKDVIDVRGWPTTGGSRLFDGQVAADDAGCVRRLREAGAIIIGKTNLHELTVGGHDNPWFGKVVNPLDHQHGTGGTSSGSAAAVRAGFCLAALGTDTGGSNRSPAAATGLVGFKPQGNAVDRSGVLPTAASFDAIGPIAMNVSDAWRVYAALEGRSHGELATVGTSGIRIGLCPDLYGSAVDPALEGAIDSWLDHARGAGASIQILRFKLADRVRDAGAVILFHEFAAHYAGLVREHPNRVGPTVTQFLAEASVFSDVAYRDALLFRDEAKRVFLEMLSTVDLLVTPVAPGLAPRLSDEATRVGSTFVSYGLAGGSFRRWANFFDLPTLAMPLPCAGNLPASVQVCTAPGAGEKLFAMCRTLSLAA